MCIKGLIWPPLEPKTEICFSPISFDWFVRRITEMLNFTKYRISFNRYSNLFLNAYLNHHAYTEYLKMIEVYSPCGIYGMFFYIVFRPISITSGLWSTGNMCKCQQIDINIYQCDCDPQILFFFLKGNMIGHEIKIKKIRFLTSDFEIFNLLWKIQSYFWAITKINHVVSFRGLG